MQSRLTTWLQKVRRTECMQAIKFLNQSVSEPELFKIQFHLCNRAVDRRVKAQWASDEEIVGHRCDYCAYDAGTVYKILEGICPD